ncbi:reverse transcriptase domain-containing protein [Saccharopolyspora sp. NPDC002376]
MCRQRCFEKDWVVDLDVKAFFDSVPWELMCKAVERHATQPWVMLYVRRWLRAPMLMPDGSPAHRTKGTPQGGPISPLIANVFLHYGFDTWMAREFPTLRFERFADDVVVHCVTERQAHQCARRSVAGSPTSGCSCIPTRRGSCTARTTGAAWTSTR